MREQVLPEDLTLGILMIIIDDFPNEAIWRLWLEEFNAGSVERNSLPRVQFWFHAKYPDRITSAWVRSRLVTSFHYTPEWGSVEITKAMVGMLHEVQ